MNYNFHQSLDEKCHRFLNAVEPGTVVAIHRHRKSSETVVCLRGRLVEEFYDELERRCTEAIELSPGGPVVALNIPIGQWHTVRTPENPAPSSWKSKTGLMNPRGRKIYWLCNRPYWA